VSLHRRMVACEFSSNAPLLVVPKSDSKVIHRLSPWPGVDPNCPSSRRNRPSRRVESGSTSPSSADTTDPRRGSPRRSCASELDNEFRITHRVADPRLTVRAAVVPFRSVAASSSCACICLRSAVSCSMTFATRVSIVLARSSASCAESEACFSRCSSVRTRSSAAS